jgi:hypothetical protein
MTATANAEATNDAADATETPEAVTGLPNTGSTPGSGGSTSEAYLALFGVLAVVSIALAISRRKLTDR